MPQPFAAISASERGSGIGLEPNLIRFDPIPVPSRSCTRLERHREVAREKAERRSIERPRRAGRLFSVEEGLMADEDEKAELERLRKENEALKKGASSSVRMKVSEKGALSIYGYGTLSSDTVQGTVAEATGHVRRHSIVYCCARSGIEGKGLGLCRLAIVADLPHSSTIS
jgi:hypothetical protein